MTLYKKIEDLCYEQGIHVKRLSEIVELGNGVIGKWKKSSPKIDNLTKVADYFGVSLDYLVGRTDVREVPLTKSIQRDSRCKCAPVIESVIDELNTQGVALGDEPIDIVTELIQKILKSNLEVWTLLKQCSEND